MVFVEEIENEIRRDCVERRDEHDRFQGRVAFHRSTRESDESNGVELVTAHQAQVQVVVPIQGRGPVVLQLSERPIE